MFEEMRTIDERISYMDICLDDKIIRVIIDKTNLKWVFVDVMKVGDKIRPIEMPVKGETEINEVR